IYDRVDSFWPSAFKPPKSNRESPSLLEIALRSSHDSQLSVLFLAPLADSTVLDALELLGQSPSRFNTHGLTYLIYPDSLPYLLGLNEPINPVKSINHQKAFKELKLATTAYRRMLTLDKTGQSTVLAPTHVLQLAVLEYLIGEPAMAREHFLESGFQNGK